MCTRLLICACACPLCSAGETPLYRAVRRGNAARTLALLQQGAGQAHNHWPHWLGDHDLVRVTHKHLTPADTCLTHPRCHVVDRSNDTGQRRLATNPRGTNHRSAHPFTGGAQITKSSSLSVDDKCRHKTHTHTHVRAHTHTHTLSLSTSPPLSDPSWLLLLVARLQFGSDPNTIVELTGNSPLHEAAQIGDEENAQILLDFGADPTAKNKWVRWPVLFVRVFMYLFSCLWKGASLGFESQKE